MSRKTDKPRTPPMHVRRKQRRFAMTAKAKSKLYNSAEGLWSTNDKMGNESSSRNSWLGATKNR